MKMVESQFDSQDKSVESLTARNSALDKSIDSQKKKIDTLKEALKNSTESFGENDRRTKN
jgi:phage-related minor tail protein